MASGAGSTSRWGSSTCHGCCSSTSRPRGSIRRAGPTSGSHIRGLHAEHGTTLFLTTHYLDEADALCDRILVIDQGRIVAEGTPDALKRRVSGDLVLVGTGEPGRVAAIAERLGPAHASSSSASAPPASACPMARAVLPGLLRELDAAGVAMTSVEVRRPSLDDVFLTLTGRTLRDAEQKVAGVTTAACRSG